LRSADEVAVRRQRSVACPDDGLDRVVHRLELQPAEIGERFVVEREGAAAQCVVPTIAAAGDVALLERVGHAGGLAGERGPGRHIGTKAFKSCLSLCP